MYPASHLFQFFPPPAALFLCRYGSKSQTMNLSTAITALGFCCLPYLGFSQGNTGTVLPVPVTTQQDGKSKVKTKSRRGETKTKIETAEGQRKIEVERDGTTKVTTDNPTDGKTKITYPAPFWASARNYANDRPVYFPDYYMFYTPGRGYTYWQDGAWHTSESYPDFYSSVDWTSANMHILTDADLSLHAENEFPRYREQYPAVQVPDVR